MLAAALLAALSFAQANDVCSGALALSIDTPTPFETSGASASALPWSCTDGGIDLWYAYTVFGNDDCAAARPMVSGNYPGLNVDSTDPDFFIVDLVAGGTLVFDCLHSVAEADLDIYLWDPAVACDSRIEGEAASTALAQGFTSSDDESITYTNVGSTDVTLVLEVRVWSASAGDCGTYDLVLDAPAGDPGPPLGTSYCSTTTNSTGVAAEMFLVGQAEVAANDLVLLAAEVPPGQFGIFIVSPEASFVPLAGGTSNGNLCLGAPIGRFVAPGQVRQASPGGTFDLPIDLMAIPQGAGTVSVQPGDTYRFQAWFRDGVGLGSNFTDGREVTFL